MTDNQTTMMALRIEGNTMSQIIAIDLNVMELTLKDIWNGYYVRDFPDPGSSSRKPGRIDMIVPAVTFHKMFRFTSGRTPRERNHFAEVERK